VWRLLADHTTWITYTTQNSPLVSDYVEAVMVDGQGHRWFATDHGTSVFAAGEGQWADFSASASSLAVDSQGRVWFADYSGGARVLDYGASPFDPGDDEWTIYNGDRDLGNKYVEDILVDGQGDVWFATNYSGLVRYDTPASPIGPILWEHSAILSAASGGTAQEAAGLTAAELGVTGKLYLEADLNAESGQALAAARYPFYIFGTDTGLTLEADRSVYRPGQIMTLSGQALNGASLPLTGQTLTVWVDNQVVYTETDVSVPAGGSYPFSVSTSVPQEDGEVTLRASLQDVRIEDVVRVSSPALAAFLEAPAVVGRNPFNLRLTLDNPTLLDLSVTATLDGDAQTVDIPPGETQVVSYTAQITGDTLFSLQISGDVTDTLTRSIQMGESAAIVFAPQPLYPPGRAAVPYTVTNTGLLPTTFPLSVTLHAGMDLVQTETLSIALPAGDSASGLLMFDVAEGDYLLGFSSPFEAGSLSWRVVPFDQVSLGVEARPPVETEIPLDVTITNTGVNTFAGHLALDATFFSQQLPIDLDVGQVLTSVVSVDTTYAAPGTHPVTLTVLADNGALLATQVVSISAAPPSFVLVSPPVSATLVAGDVATLTFEVENTGGTRGEARFNLNFSDIGDNSQWLSLAPGETGRFDFSFTVPAELVTRDYVATYVLSNTVTGETLENDLTLTVSGLELDVSATLDQAVYASGQTASLTLDIVNLSPSATGDLYAVVRYGSFEDSQSFSLAGSGTRSLTFAVPVDFEAGDTIFYGVYDQASNRGVHLNTIHIYPLNPSATLTTDRQVYQPGQTVQATVATSATGTLLVQAPGYSQTLTVTGSDANFSFTLPSPMAEGSYEIRYTLVDCACEDEGQPYLYRFDVAGIQMSVVQAALERDTYASGDTIRLNLIVASHQALPASLRTYVIYPDGSQSQPLDRPVRLEAIENNHLVAELPFVTSMVGPHALVYGLLDPDDEELWYAAGAAGFDVGAVMLAGLTTDKDVYAYTDEVVNLQVQAFGVATSTGTLDLKLDGVSVQSQPLTSGEGIQSFDMPLAVPVTPGFHRLSAVLESGDGPSQSTTYFTYGTQAADLQASALWPAGAADSITRTLNVLVANQGGEPAPASLLAFYDGDPAGDGVLIGQAPVSDLDVDAETQTQIVWNIRGQGGAHLLYTMADSENDVAEFRENNNVRQTSVTLPRFILRAVALEETYELGEVLTPSVRLENLLGDTSLAGTLTTTISFIGEDLYYDVISQTHVLMLAPEETEDVSLTWDTAQLSSGLYRIEHTFVDDTGEERSAESLIELIEPTRAYFLAAPRSGAVPLIVNFSDRSTGRIITRTWNFGDGITQTITSTTFLSHTYTLASVYTASLTVVDVDSVTDTTSLTITATTPISLVAAFNAEPLRGIVPFTVTFVDESVGQVLTRTWSFGDGSSPVNTSAMTIDHRYEIPGVYSVTLAVYNSAGSDVITQSNYILAVSPQTSGTVTLDAENYARQVSGPGPAWETRTTYPGYAGDGYVQALPDVDVLFDTDLIGAGSALQYDLGLTVTGTYTIWLRGYAANAAGDSVYVGLNGQPITSTDYVSAFPPARRPAVAGTWAWANTWAGSGQPITFTIETPGVHTLDIWVREDGFSLDQIILTTEENFNPGG
jgi:PKD repeat protein